MTTGSKHALNWTSILVAIPVGLVATLVTLGFRHAIELINTAVFGTQQDVTQAIGVYAWYFWPLIVGIGGLIAGFFLRYATAIEQKETVRTDYLEVINARLDVFRIPSRLIASLDYSISPTRSAPSGYYFRYLPNSLITYTSVSFLSFCNSSAGIVAIDRGLIDSLGVANSFVLLSSAPPVSSITSGRATGTLLGPGVTLVATTGPPVPTVAITTGSSGLSVGRWWY